MRAVIRSLWIVVLALVGTVGVVVAWTTATAVQLLATALIMGGTDHPLSTPPDDPVTYIDPYMDNAIEGFINAAAGVPTGTGGAPISTVGEDDDRYAVIYPAEFFPVFGSRTFDESVSVGFDNLNSCVRGTGCIYNDSAVLDPPEDAPGPGGDFVIFGYSQSAVVASLVKRDLIENRPAAPTDVSFFLLANPMRPNGGILARGPQGLTIPILGVTFHGATPTNSCESGPCYETVDLVAQYDGLGGDAPASLTNVLAILNAAAGYYYLHGNLQNETFDEDVRYQGSYGDTDYYILPAERLPILMPFEGLIPSPILTALEAPLKEVIEGAYARDVNPGIATGASLLPFRDPIRTILNILQAVPIGIDDALEEAAGVRPLGTTPVTSPFGLSGPDLPATPPAALAEASEADVVSRNDVETETLDSGESVEEVVAVEEEEVLEGGPGEEEGAAGEEEVDEEEAAEEEDAEVNNPPATEPEQPKLRGPVEFDSREPTQAPSTAEPATGQTTTGEPESTSGDDEGQAAA